MRKFYWKMSLSILSFILLCLPSFSLAVVDLDLTRSLQLENIGAARVKQFEVELAKNCTSESPRRGIARLAASGNNFIDDVKAIHIKIRWNRNANSVEEKATLQYQIVQTKLGGEVKSGKPSTEFQHLGCLTVTVTTAVAAEQNVPQSQRKEAQQPLNKRGMQVDLSHLRDVDVIVKFPTKSDTLALFPVGEEEGT